MLFEYTNLLLVTEYPPEARARLGTVVDGRYWLDALLGMGSASFVYRARHIGLSVRRAVKLLRRTQDARARARFFEEARMLAKLDDPHVVRVLDYGELGDATPFLVMDHLRGATLERVMHTRAPLPLARMCHLGEQIAQGLSAVHAEGVVHRDLKPANVFVCDPQGIMRVRLLDFGVSLGLGTGAPRRTQRGVVLGTPHYMAPEVVTGRQASASSDLYALGVMLCEMATGVQPFTGPNLEAVMRAHVHGSVPHLPSHLPRAFTELVVALLHKRPEARPQQAQEVAACLRSFITQDPQSPRACAPVVVPCLGDRPGFGAEVVVPLTPAPARMSGQHRPVMWMAAACIALGCIALGTALSAKPSPGHRISAWPHLTHQSLTPAPPSPLPR